MAPHPRPEVDVSGYLLAPHRPCLPAPRRCPLNTLKGHLQAIRAPPLHLIPSSGHSLETKPYSPAAHRASPALPTPSISIPQVEPCRRHSCRSLQSTRSFDASVRAVHIPRVFPPSRIAPPTLTSLVLDSLHVLMAGCHGALRHHSSPSLHPSQLGHRKARAIISSAASANRAGSLARSLGLELKHLQQYRSAGRSTADQYTLSSKPHYRKSQAPCLYDSPSRTCGHCAGHRWLAWAQSRGVYLIGSRTGQRLGPVLTFIHSPLTGEGMEGDW